MIVLKLCGARIRKRATEGRCEGRKPHGEREGEAEVIERIQRLRDAGMAMDTIAETLKAEGVAPRGRKKAGPKFKWHGSTVRNVPLRAKRPL
jgi:Recombinase